MTLRNAALAAVVVFASGGLAVSPAWAARAVTLPSDLDLFATTGSGGPINPGVLVGFNPQPDPPGSPVPLLDLTDPTHPSLSLTGVGTYSILFGFNDASGTPYQFTLPTAPLQGNADGHASYSFLATAGDGSVFQMSFDLSGINGAAVGFNPQPDPPGFGGSIVGFSFQGDPMMSWTLDSGTLDGNGNFSPSGVLSFDQVPEPATMMLFGSGLLALGMVRRKD